MFITIEYFKPPKAFGFVFFCIVAIPLHVYTPCKIYMLLIQGAGEQPTFSPRRLQLFNTLSRQSIIELSFVDTVLAVAMNRTRLAVTLQHKLHLFDLETVKLLHSLDTPKNTRGVFVFYWKYTIMTFPRIPLVEFVFIYYISFITRSYTLLSGVGALSPSDNNCFLAIPAHESLGEVMVFDAKYLKVIYFHVLIYYDDASVRIRVVAFVSSSMH